MSEIPSRERSSSYDESFLNRKRGNDSDLIVLKPTEPERRRAMEAPPVMRNVCRTNFGKRQVYQPPETKGWRGYVSHQDADSIPFDQEASEIGRRIQNGETKTADGDAIYRDLSAFRHQEPLSRVRSDHSQPFDVYQDAQQNKQSLAPALTRVGSEKHRPFDEISDIKAETDWEANPPLRPKRNYHSDQDLYFSRFQVPPARVSPPILSPYTSSLMDNVKSDESMEAVIGNKEKNESSFVSDVPTDESSMLMNFLPMHALTKESRQPDGDDDDSLFDFTDEGKYARSMNRGKRRSRKTKAQYETDDTSSDRPYGAVTASTSLQERSQAAWKRKASKGANSSQQVSFGAEKDNTIQYYDPENDETMETSTLGGRSLNSMYTKSAESEVEDIIKDIFLIGDGKSSNPGRRKIKDSPAVKNKLRKRDELIEIDDGTLETYEETPLDTTVEEEETSRESSSPQRLAKMSARKGTDSATAETTTRTTRSSGESYTRSDVSSRDDTRFESTSRSRSTSWKSRGSDTIPRDSSSFATELTEGTAPADPFSNVWGFLFGADGKKTARRNRGLETVAEDDESLNPVCVKPEDNKGGLENFLTYASDVILGPEPSPIDSQKKTRKVKGTSAVDVVRVETNTPAIESAVSLEEDFRLVDLAVQAARSRHRINGCELDESYSIDIVEDISFIVVDLEMPLGLIFQENETGCWITKVLANGSASKKGKVQIGDQLAAIDGMSAINMNVGQIADAITSKEGEIELTFLRYIGPLHPVPGSVAEEGWEVRNARNEERSAAPKPDKHSVGGGQTPGRGLLRGLGSKTSSKLEESKVSQKKGGTQDKRRFRLFRRKKAH